MLLQDKKGHKGTDKDILCWMPVKLGCNRDTVDSWLADNIVEQGF